jgi:hypothetical protein
MNALSTPENNLPTLYQNIIFGLPSQFAVDVFLWATERQGNDRLCYKAERFAREAACLVGQLVDLLKTRQRVLGNASLPVMAQEQEADLLSFILTRHANNEWGGNLKPPYVYYNFLKED